MHAASYSKIFITEFNQQTATFCSLAQNILYFLLLLSTPETKSLAASFRFVVFVKV